MNQHKAGLFSFIDNSFIKTLFFIASCASAEKTEDYLVGEPTEESATVEEASEYA